MGVFSFQKSWFNRPFEIQKHIVVDWILNSELVLYSLNVKLLLVTLTLSAV
jgi:hypothetical protein